VGKVNNLLVLPGKYKKNDDEIKQQKIINGSLTPREFAASTNGLLLDEYDKF